MKDEGRVLLRLKMHAYLRFAAKALLSLLLNACFVTTVDDWSIAQEVFCSRRF